MKGILHDILDKIKGVYNNWHGTADPAATVQKHTQEFMGKAADLIHGLEEQLAALGGDVEGSVVGEFMTSAKQRIEDLETLAKNFVSDTTHGVLVDEVASVKAQLADALQHGAALEESLAEQGKLLSQALTDIAALKTPPAAPSDKPAE